MKKQAEENAKKRENKQFYNQPNAEADFDYWSKMPEWTVDEAIVLSFGKCPEIVTWSRLKPISPYNSPFVKEFLKLKKLVLRAKEATLFSDSYISLSSDPIRPYKFVKWMQTNSLLFPKELQEQVFHIYELNKPPKTDIEIAMEKFKETSSECKSLNQKAEKLAQRRTAQKTKEHRKEDSQLSTKEKMLILISLEHCLDCY